VPIVDQFWFKFKLNDKSLQTINNFDYILCQLLLILALNMVKIINKTNMKDIFNVLYSEIKTEIKILNFIAVLLFIYIYQKMINNLL